ncbi:hypothetical protein Poli38472_010378 [Pythium oligandrum]|uniref:Thioredoxin domain-containing protein n=1 Tax=Pythium oligandrum TaxID=41045 RepID=A0A8K1C2Y7_PYTOL|nr:hypothetical protein Poli38472_010378 [Pythium oligandrum]|eukprot:TMW55496.1 hypothetical protein Poli38472_010378 [Pythium oligandrum]
MTEMATPRVTARRFFRAYYILNTTVLLAYLVIRQLAWNSELEERQGFLNIPLEQEIFLLVAIMFAMNYRKKATIDGLVAMFFMYTKTGVLAALYYLDRRIFGWMLAYCAFLFIAVGQPKYDGPDNIFPLNPATMEQEITRNGGYKASKKRVSWLVYFYADWNDNCLQHDAMVADLSLQFGSETLRFGKVDVNKYPELAREHSIEVSATSSQLPTLILFQGGQEIKRLPWIKEDGKVAKVILDRPGLEAVFMLPDLKDGKKSAFLAKSK